MSKLRAKIEAAIAAQAVKQAEEQQRAEGVLTHARLQELVNYNPDDGHFTRLLGKNKGERAGYQNINGYVYVYLDGNEYSAHGLAWFYTHGSWPTQDIDHKNRLKNDNRIENLRDVSKSDNMLNVGLNPRSTTGIRNVHETPSGRWKVYRNDKDKRIYVGTYKTKEEAAEEAKKYYGDLANVPGSSTTEKRQEEKPGTETQTLEEENTQDPKEVA